MESPHVPVLLNEVVDTFKDRSGVIVDCTIGYGGHSEALLRSNPNITIVGIDRDSEAIQFSLKRLEPFKNRVQIIKGRFSQVIRDVLRRYPVKGVLADIGVSSLQLDKNDRGFSIHSDRLDMRMDKEASLSAEDVVNVYDIVELERILKEYGEIPNYKKIARLIVQNRPIKSAKELANLVAKHLPKKGKIHPATTLFQAIRIEVNQELEELRGLLQVLQNHKPSGARIAIITFHSLEDRIVKQTFKEWAKKCICPPEAMRCSCGANHALGKIVTKKPIVASKEELRSNLRSRSAKMRVFDFKEEC